MSSIIGLFYTIYEKSINNKTAWIWGFGIVCFTAVLIVLVLLMHSEKYESWNECSKYAKGLHDILHCLRDMNKELDDLRIRDSKIEKKDFRRIITSDCIDIMNKLSRILSESMRCKVRTCIKLNDFIKENETDIHDIKLITFARSGNEGVNAAFKEQSNTIKVIENTDFEYIFKINEIYEENRIHYFYQKDLKKYDKKLRKESNGTKMYKNSDKHWRKRYNTTIVMPMRYLKSSNKDEALYDIVGFLCVDAKKSGSFENKNFYFTVEFLKGVSDILYSYLNSCITYYKSIDEEDE